MIFWVCDEQVFAFGSTYFQLRNRDLTKFSKKNVRFDLDTFTIHNIFKRDIDQ